MIKPGMFKQIAAVAVIAAFLFHVAGGILPAQSENEITGQFEKIKSSYNNGQYTNAKVRIERLIGTITEKKLSLPYIMGQCYLLLGAIYEKEENITLAEENYKKGKIFGITKVEGVNLEDLKKFKDIVNGGMIEGPGIKKKKKFPWLWVIGGAVAVGVTLYFLLKKKEKKYYNLTIVERQGVEGTPGFGTHRYEEGTVVEYTYRARNGYSNLEVLRDGTGINPSGTITMDANHTLTFTVSQNQYQLQVSTTELQVPETQTASFTVQLTQQPAGNVTVTTVYLDGDGDISVESGGTHTFNSNNWDSPKTVTLRAADDGDLLHGSTRFNVAIQGQTPIVVTATEIDKDIDETLTVRITEPENNDTVSGTVNIYAEASGKRGIAKVEYYIDGDLVKTDLNEPFKLKWNSNTVPDGPHTVKVTAHDILGQTVDHQISLTVRNDPGNFQLVVNRASHVTGSPETGNYSYKSGATVNYSYQAESGFGPLVVLLDNQPVQTTGTIIMDRDHTLVATVGASQYQLTVTRGEGVNGEPATGVTTYDSGAVVNYSYTAANSGESVSVLLDGQSVETSGDILMNRDHTLEATTNPVVLIVDPMSLKIVEGQTDQVNVHLSAQPQGNISVTASIIENSGDSDIELVSGQTLDFSPSDWSTPKPVILRAVKDDDNIDNPTAILRLQSDELPSKDIDVSKIEDVPPVVKFDEPQNGASVSGEVPIRVRASDAIGITKIDLYIDGELKYTVNQSILDYTWSTTGLELANHTIRAVATDTGGLSDDATITVLLVNAPPQVTEITVTPSDVSLSGTVSVTVKASDDRGVDIVRVYIGENQIQEWDHAAQTLVEFTFDLDTTTYTNGVYSLRAVAVDSDGVEGEPYSINIAIQN